MGTTRKYLRGMDKVSLSSLGRATKLQKAVSAVTAIGFVLQPVAAMASVITRVDGNGAGQNLVNQGKAEIFAEKVVGQVAMNNFQQFQLEAGHIANMYFKEANGTADAASLVNLVNSRIDINGTVNAIQNSKIGGKLFFLSKEGMVVGAQGVINAGSLYVATPTESSFNKAVQGFNNDQVDNNIENALFTSIPINASGTITVLGKINAVDSVNLRAPKIGIGQNVSGDTQYDVTQGKAGAAIKTGVVDFSDFVNTTGLQSGLTGEALTATQTGSGDIVLSAYNSYNDKYAGIIKDDIKFPEETIAAELAVAEGADITAAGKAKLSATAVNNVEVTEYKDADKTTSGTNSHLFGQVVDTQAKVTINGQVTGEQVDISANAYNHYVSSESSSLLKDYGGDTSKILSLLGLNLDGAYGVLGSEATVDIGEKAVIKATAADKAVTDKDGNNVTEKALSITANSTVDLGVGATAGSLQLLKKDPLKFVPGAGFSYAKGANKAEVTINGALASAGSTEIAAKADSKLAASSTSSAGISLGAAAVTVANGSNSSKVTIGKQAKMADGNLKGDVSITAKSTNSINTKANVSAGNDGLLTTAINVTAYDSKANVDIQGSINANGSLDIAAENVVTDNIITANNAMGSSAMDTKINAFKENALKNSSILDIATGKDGLVERLRNWVADWTITPGFLKNIIKVKPKKDEPEQPKPTEPTIVDNIKGLFSAGASVGIANESNTANVSIGQGVSLTAAEDLTIKADSTIQDTQMNVTGSSANNADKSQKKAMVNAAVLYTNLENNATVTVAGGEAAATEATNVQLTGQNVDVQANAVFEYNRINRMVAEILEACQKVEEAYNKELPHDLSPAIADLRTKANAVTAFREAHPNLSFDEFMASEEFKALLQSSDALDKLVAENNSAEFAKLKDVAIDSLSVAGVAKKFADATNYLNFNAGSANNGKEPAGTPIGGGDAGNGTSTQADASGNAGSTTGENQGAAASVAGSVTITGLTNNAKVLIGKNAVINAEQKADLKATSKQTDVTLTGKLGLNGGGDTAVGGTVGLGFADANSLVVVAKGAKITAGDINLQAKNEISHTNITAGAGKGASVGVNGMVSYLTGNSNSIVSVDDEAVLTATKAANNTGKITIKAQNDTNVISIAGALSLGDTAGVGAGVAITDFERYNYAAITDNGYIAPTTASAATNENSNDEDSDTDEAASTEAGAASEDNMQENTEEAMEEATNADRSENAANLTSIADKKLSKLQQLIQDNSGLAENEQEAFFGSQTAADSTGGSITASGLDVSAETTGNIINLTVAGGISTGDDSGEVGIGDKVNAFVTNKTNGVKNMIYSIDNSVAKWLNGLLKRETKEKSVFQTNVQPTAQPTKKYNSFTIAGAGSASVNMLDGDTAAIIDGARIKINNTDAAGENVSVNASDSALVVAGSGAAGISWKNLMKNENANSTNVAVAGAVGVNNIDSATLAVIRNSKIDNADAIINNAQKKGAVVAAGVGLGVSKNSQGNNGGTNVAASVNASVNLVDNTVYALMQDNEVNQSAAASNKTSLTNSAFDNDIQITGGLSSSVAIGGNNAYVGGATVSYGSLKNDIQSAIIGGNYNSIGTADVTAKTNMTQVGVAANASVAAGADTSYGFGGASAYNKLDNYANATVEGVSFSGEGLNVAAYDTAETANEHQEDIKARHFDADGQEYLAGIKDTVNEQKDNEGNAITPVDNTRKGNIIVTGATTMGVTTGNDGGTAGAALSISDIDNDFNASIKNSKIITTGVGSGDSLAGTSVAANSNTILAGVAAGVSGTKGNFGVGGSANWQLLHNDVTASIENSTVQAPRVDVKAVSSALAINVAGQLGVTAGQNSKVGAGLALAYNTLKNTTGAYVKGATISGVDGNASALNVSAANKGSVYSVGAAVGAGTATVTADGAIVVNEGKNDVEAVIDQGDGDKRTTLNNMSEVNVKASDESKQLAVVGAVSVAAGSGSKASVGGTIVINDLGSLASGKQSNTAAIRNTDITTKNNGAINVNAVDRSALTTISVDLAATTGNAAFSGAGAAALIEKETKAELIGTNVNNNDSDTDAAAVSVGADSNSSITTVGVVLAGSTKEAAGGLGIAVNRINADTTTTVDGGSYKVKDLTAKAKSAANMKVVGIAAGAAKNAGLAGNVAVNLIGNNTKAEIKNAAITASGNIAALAESKETLQNYAGAMAVAAGGQAGIGMSVAYNEITGNTESVVENATLNAAGTGAALGEAVSEKHKDSKGIIVAADAEHDLDNIIVTAGLAASSDAAVGVAGTVAVNHLAGATNAKIKNSTANTNGSAGDVSVLAKDITDVNSIVGSASVAGGADAAVAVGAASDTNLLQRNVTAEIDGGNGEQKAFNAAQLKVAAQSSNEITTTAVGAAIAVAAYGTAGVAGTVSVTKSDATTMARVNNIISDNQGLTVNAERNNNITLAGASLAVTGSIGGGSAGISVGVLSDDSHTEAQLTNAKITHSTTADAVDNIHAGNNTTVTTGIAAEAAAISIGGAAAGSVGVNNLNNTVKTSVLNSEINNANTITADAQNSLTTSFTSVAAAGGLGAGAVGVGVNTIDTSVVTEVDNSKLQAQNVNVKADETRKITQTAMNAAVGGVALGTNILVTNIGSAVQKTYTTGNDESIALDGTNANGQHYALADADAAIGEQNSTNNNAYNNFVKQYKSDNSNASNALTAVGRGGSTEAKGVQVKISGNSEITATNKADIEAKATTNTDITSGGATVGGAAASGTFSVLNVKRNSGVTVENSTIAAKELAIASRQAGTAKMSIYQGAVGGAAVNVGVGMASLTGENKVTLKGATLIGGTDESDGKDHKTSISVKAEDTSAVDVEVIGATAGVSAVGVLWSDAANESENTISVADSNLRAAKEVYETRAKESADGSSKNESEEVLVGYTDLNNIDIAAVKANTITAKTIGGAVGANSVQGVVAKAADSGSSRVTVTGNNTFIGNVVNITAQNNPAVKAEAQAYSGALLASAGATIAQAKAAGTVEVNIGEGSEFTAKTVNAEASVGTQNGEANVEAKTIGGSAAGLANVGFNEASAENSMTVKNNIEENTYIGVENLNIIADNASVIKADVFGVTIGGALSVANNLAKTTTNLTTTVNAKGAVDKITKDEYGNETVISSLGKVNIKGAGYGEVTSSVSGNGGGLIAISPIAAKAKNELTTKTNVNVSGNWNNIGSMTANATNSDNLDIDADSVTAAVVGASGTQIDNTVSHTANVGVTGTVTSTGKQSYNASNTVNHDVDLKGNGYGVGAGAAAAMTNNLSYTAKVNMNDATLKGIGDSGAIEALASTSGKMDYDNIIKSAGLVAGTFAQSNNTLTYDNGITLTNAQLSTAKLDQDITLAATDETKANFETMADTQGGAVGASGATTKNTLTRNNRIAIDAQSNLLSTNDVNIYAGANADGISSSLNYNVVADAYNKTLLPVGTKPKVDNTMVQNNQVNIAGNVTSVRHVNLKATKGLTTVAESAREYNIYTGNSGSGSLTSTAFGEQNSNETPANRIDITGKVKAGIHNSLDLKITGSTKVNAPKEGDETGESGSLDFTNIKAETGANQEWFKVNDNVGIGVGTITNSLMDRYLELNKLLGQYNSGSDEYTSLKAEQDRIVEQMTANGFTREVAADEKGGKRLEIFSEIDIPVLDINDIVISGGNINIDVDVDKTTGEANLTGRGNLNAQGAGNLSVTNESDLYLKINDLVIKDKGGQIYLNGSSLNANDAAGDTNITVKSTGQKNAALDSAPDIGIFGRVINSTGDVTIENTNYDINVDGNANISARNIILKADNGSVTQNSEGLLLVGGDPVTKWQFSDSIAKKIQDYLSTNVGENSANRRTFDSFDDYKQWLLDESGFGFDETEKNEIRHYNYDDSKGIVAGNNVYISGLNVNIDGLVQSGYQNYKVDLSNDQKAQDKLAELESEFNANKKALTNQEVMANEHYCLTTDAGANYNSETGVYDYNVRVYYNPYTKELLTESIEPNGGKIYITGAISSTGSGKLRAMDGTPDISIDTSTIDRDLRVNSIANKNVEGLISIRDTATNTLTEYKNKDGQVEVSTISIAKKGETADTANRATSTKYNPKAGMTFSWTGGSSGGQTIRAYEYTKKFIAWGLIKYSTSRDFITNEEVSNGKVETSVSSISGNDPLGKGIIIGVKTSSPEYSVSTSKWTTSEPEPSEIVSNKKYSGTAGKIFGYGKVHYTWTETTGTSTSSTYTIKADKAIDVGFMTGGKGDISITSEKNMLLNGNISNATDANGNAIGKVTLKSNAGSISSVGNARVDADNLTISAATGVDINHGALGKEATIDVKSASGNVTINSDKGNLTFTGGADAGAKAGNLNLTAAGNLQTATGTILNGTRIDLVSAGAINANIAPGQELTSSDTMSASVNAKAQGNITLTNDNGDMRLGVIDSAQGDVVLTTSGSFIDAVGEATLSDSDSKLAKWKEMGLVSDAADANDRANAAAASKQERLEALEIQAKQLALKADKTEANEQNTLLNEYKAVAADYATKGDSAFEGKDYSDEVKSWIKTYASMNNSESYGWSQNDLLYAVQAGVLQSQPGEILTTDKANVTGKNITLNAGKNIGIDGEAKSIKYADLSKEENMKLLAQAKGGDLTWKDDALEVRQQKQITVQLKDGGKLNLNANTSKTEGEGNIYLAGVKDTLLDVSGTINTSKDVKLLSDKGVSMKEGSISADNLIIYGGNGDVGSADNYIKTNIKGSLDANSKYNVYIHQLATAAGQAANVLTIQNIAAQNVYLSADNGMRMTAEQGKTSGGINAALINLTATGGNIGVAGDGIRILEENGAVINAKASAGSIYLQGIDKAGRLELNEVEAKKAVEVKASGDINVGKDTEKGSVKAGTSASLTGKDINLNAGSIAAGTSSTIAATDNVNLAAGTLSAGADSSITAAKDIKLGTSAVTISGENTSLKLNAGETVMQDETAAGVKVANLRVESSKTQRLLSRNNNIKSLVITGKKLFGSGENAPLTVDGMTKYVGTMDNLDVTVANSNIIGDVIIENYQEDTGKVTINTTINTSRYDDDHKGTITVKADSNITVADDIELNAADKLEITSKQGKITAGGKLSAGTGVEITTGKGSIEAKRDITAAAGDVNVKTSAGDITTAGVSAAAGDVSLATDSGFIKTADVKAANNVTAKATGDITANGNIEATKGGATINSSGASVSIKNVTAGTNVDIDAGTSVATDDVKAGTDVDIAAGASVITDNVNAGNNIDVDAKTGITANGAITSSNADVILKNISNNITTAAITGKNVSLTNEKGNVLMKGAAKADTAKGTLSVSVTESGDITANSTLDGKVINLFTKNGKITTSGDVTATDTAKLETVKGDIEAAKVTAENDAILTTKEGNITANSEITSKNADITLNTDKGAIAAKADVKAANNVTANATGDITTGNIEAANSRATIKSSGASVSIKDVKAGANVDIAAGASVATDNVTAGTDVDIAAGASVATKDVKANTDVDIDAGASVTTDNVTAGNSTKLTAGSTITTKGNVKAAAGNVSYDAKTGITTNGSVSAGTDVSMSNQENDITASAEINARNDVALTNNNGSITTGSSVTAGNDSRMNTTTGNINANGSVSAGNNSSMNTTTGNITTGSTVTAGNDASFNVDQNGNVTTKGDVTANKDITYDAKGSLTTGGSLNSTVGNINLTTDAAKGDMTFGGDVNTKDGSIGITAKGNGNLQFNGNVITANGNIDILVEGDGNVNDDDKLFSATCKEHDKDDKAGSITDPKAGNVTLQIKGIGDVDLNEIYATHNARVDVANGNLKLAKIDGDLVAVQLRTEGKQMDLKDIIAGTKIVAKGSNMALDKIKQREGADGMLTIVPDGAKDDAPIDNLRIGEIATNTGVRFEHLWLNTGDIHVSDGKLHIDKLVVNDNAHFSNAQMTSAVWGNPPQRDDSDSVYWNNTAVNNPKDEFSKASNELNDWIKSGTNAAKWMFLHFTEVPNIQQSNGVLLGLNNYNYVYNQRFNAVDHLNRVHADDKLHGYDIGTEPEIVHYFRYDLYDLDEHGRGAAAKVVVEA